MPSLVLVAEDDRMISLMTCSILRREGYVVEAAFDVASTVRRALAAPVPDLLVLDMRMPDGDASDVLRRLGADPTAGVIPVLLLSGAAAEDLNDLAARYSVAAILRKPVDPESLAAAVRSALGASGGSGGED